MTKDAPPGVAFREARVRPADRARAPTTSSTRPESGRTGSGPDELLTEEEIPRIRPSRGTHVTLSTDELDIGTAACIVPAGGDRTIFALPWYGRVLVGTTDNDYDGDIDHVPPERRRRRVPARGAERLLRHRSRTRTT